MRSARAKDCYSALYAPRTIWFPNPMQEILFYIQKERGRDREGGRDGRKGGKTEGRKGGREKEGEWEEGPLLDLQSVKPSGSQQGLLLPAGPAGPPPPG